MKLLTTIAFCLLLPLGAAAQSNLRVLFAGNGVPTWECSAAQYIDRDTNLLYLCDDTTRTWGPGIPALSLLPSLNLSDLASIPTARANLGLDSLFANKANADLSNVTGTVDAVQSGVWNLNNIIGTISLPTGAATETTLIGIKAGTDRIPASPATDRTNAGAPFSFRLSDGTAFYRATTPSDTQPVSLATNTPDVTDRVGRLLGHVTVDSAPTTAVTGPLTDAQLRATPVPVSGSINIQTNAPVNVAQVGGTNTVNGGLAGSQAVGGTAANNATINQNPLLIAGETIAQGSQPAAATTGNQRRILTTLEGAQFVQEGSSNRFSCVVNAVTVTTQCQAAPGAGLRAYITGATLSNQAATVQTLDIVYGTGSNCATSPVALTHKVQFGTLATTTNFQVASMNFATPLIPAAANAICIRPSAASVFGGTLTGFIAP